MGRPPQEATVTKPVRTRRKRGGTVKMTLGEASKLLADLRGRQKDLSQSAATLAIEGPAFKVLDQEVSKLEGRINAIEALTVEVPA